MMKSYYMYSLLISYTTGKGWLENIWQIAIARSLAMEGTLLASQPLKSNIMLSLTIKDDQIAAAK